MNINGSSSEWINVWTHFVLEYFITQYLKGFTAQYSTVGVQFLHDHDYLDISLFSASLGIISQENQEMDCRHNFQFKRYQVKLECVHSYLSIISSQDMDNIFRWMRVGDGDC